MADITVQRYADRLASLTAWAGSALQLAPGEWQRLPPEVLDQVMTAYVLWLFSTGAPYSHGSYTVAGLKAWRPGLRGQIRATWRALKVWQRSEPTRVCTPPSGRC